MMCNKLRPFLGVVRGFSSLNRGATQVLEQSIAIRRHPNLEISRRTIFSDQFLFVDTFARTSRHIMETSQDTDGFKKSISSLYEKSGLQAVFTDDIVKLINVANSEKDYDFIRVILVGCLSDDMRASLSYKPLSYFFMLCHVNEQAEQAKLLWNDPTVQKFEKLLGSHSLRKIYLSILFRAEQYEELVAAFRGFERPTVTLATLVVAALTKIGTKDAFVQATEIFHNLPALSDNRGQTSGGRITALYSYFGYKTGNYVPAYDVISNSRRVSKTSKYTTNLKLLILTEVGRLKDAFLIIRSECLPSRDVTARQSRSNSKNDQDEVSEKDKKIVCVDVMKKLTTAVKERNDPELSRELTSLCKALDVSANLTNETLESLLFEPIGKNRGTSTRRSDTNRVERRRPKRDLYSD